MATLVHRGWKRPNVVAEIGPGDSVLYRRSNHSGLEEKKVQAITPSGFIKVEGRLFREDGTERKSGYYNARIWPFDQGMIDDERKEIAMKLRRAQVENANLRRPSDEVINKLHTIFIDLGVLALNDTEVR